MVEGTSFMGLGGQNLVKGATGQIIDSETLGGAITHTEVSGVAHYSAKDDDECLRRLRDLVDRLPRVAPRVSQAHDGKVGGSRGEGRAVAAPPDGRAITPEGNPAPRAARTGPKTDDDRARGEEIRVDAHTREEALYDLLPADHRMSYDMHAILGAILDGGRIDEFQEGLAREMICGDGRIHGIAVGVIANQRGLIKGRPGEKPRFGGIVYTESAEKVAYFIERCDRQRIPLLFVQDVSGFMVGPEAEHEGIIRAGARFVEAMATARVPKLVLTVNHASGAGYYAMAGQGFDPDFIFSWPTGRMGVMEGESAIQAVHGPTMDAAKQAGRPLDADVIQAIDEMREDYEHQLDAKYAGARGYIDAIIYPEETRAVLAMALRASLHNAGPHLGAFVLPPHLDEL
jgi:acetyl-CoA carboxylase carboxyltransferase component